ncbi:unnamed protein product [Lactuca saligna]|uniref:Protein kinase domain-containing protein n=1 Tax=Lactuca saligna TaxID=75948 RepID=A0AA36EBR5_LACSI|nr:unnamed protein product [Lactuca saligna]
MVHKIALDIAGALAFLHDDCNPRIFHRDGFETHVPTGIAGTFGYVAPEYALACRVSDKADVHSYGVMLLELISDKRDDGNDDGGGGDGGVLFSTFVSRRRGGAIVCLVSAGGTSIPDG